MGERRRWCTGVLVALLAAVPASCGDDGGGGAATSTTEGTSPPTDEVVVVPADEGEVTLAPGGRLALTVEQNSSVGDDWSLVGPPELEVARVVGEEYEADDPEADGSGGTLAFLLEAVGEGQTTVTLRNCFRCDGTGRPTTGGESFAELLPFTVVVEGPGEVVVETPAAAAELSDQDRSARVEPGDLVAVVLEENASVGDNWLIWSAGDRSVLQVVGEAYSASDPDLIGGGGTLLTLFRARGPGRTELTFHNCFRCDAAGDTPPEDRQYAIDLTFVVQVG